MIIVRRLVFLVFISIVPGSIFAQPVPPEDDPDKVPITGIEYLIIGGGAYGVSRLLRKKKDKSPDQ